MSDEIRQVRNKYGSRALIAAIIIAVIFIGFDKKPVAKGLILGTLFSILNFVAMAQMLPMRLGKERRKTFWFSFGGIWLRYILMGVPVFLALKFETFNFFSTAAGLFMVQVVIIVHHAGKLKFRNK